MCVHPSRYVMKVCASIRNCKVTCITHNTSRTASNHNNSLLPPIFRQPSAHLPPLQCRLVFSHCVFSKASANLPPTFRASSATAIPIGVSTLCFQQRFRQSSAWLPHIFRHCNADSYFEAMFSMSFFVASASASAILPRCFRRLGKTPFMGVCEKRNQWGFLEPAICRLPKVSGVTRDDI